MNEYYLETYKDGLFYKRIGVVVKNDFEMGIFVDHLPNNIDGNPLTHSWERATDSKKVDDVYFQEEVNYITNADIKSMIGYMHQELTLVEEKGE